MKRDFDLIRLVLLEVENNADPQNWIDPEPVGYESVEVSYHVMLLEQAGLIEGWNRSAIGVFRWSARNLTWRGHEFLEAARDDTVWTRTKNTIGQLGPGIIFDVLEDELRAEAKIVVENARRERADAAR
jgi:hypothetical protein